MKRMNMAAKVSVIVPIYKVERFIDKCASSLFEQTLDEVEFIFVDDASPDGSMDLLGKCIDRYPARKGQIKIVCHEENKGLPAARNTGLAEATGEYVFHCDSDDFVEPDMLAALYGTAKEKDADIVWCDWFLSFEHNERYMAQPSYKTPLDALKGMLGGVMKFTVWNKLARRSLYVDNQISFPAGYGMGEDMTMMMLFACAGKVAYLPKAFYHYVKLNTGSFTQTFSDRHLVELKYNVQRISNYLHDKFGDTLDKEIAYLKLAVKFPFLISNSSQKYRLWKEWYPEANKYIWGNKQLSLRSRIVQWCAWKGLFLVVRVHYVLLQRVIYGLIYR